MTAILKTLIRELKELSPIIRALALGAVVLACFLYAHQDWRADQALYERGMHAAGWVTGKDLVGGKKIQYAFRVGEKLYSGESTGGYGNPASAALSVDDEVLVFFLPEDPSVSALGDPKLRVEDQHRWMAWGLLLFLPALVMGIAAELKKHE